MAERIQIIIDAQDKASGVLKNLGSQIAGMAVSYLTSAKAFEAFGQALKFSIDQAAEAEQVDAQLAAVLQSTGEAAGMTSSELDSLATSLSKVSTYDDEAIKSSEALLLTFTNVGSDVFPQATQAILDMSAAMGQDLKSSTVQLGKALNDPIAGITALSRVGVSFTDDQKNMIKTLVEAGDTLGAQKIILAELSKEFSGSAAAAAKTYTGQVQQLKNELGNLGEAIGSDALPELTQFIGEAKNAVEWVTKNYEEIKKWGEILSWVANPLVKLGSEAGAFFRNLAFGEDTLDSATQSYTDMAQAMSFVSSSTSDFADTTQESAEAVKHMTEVNREYLDFVGSMTDELNDQSKQMQEYADKNAELTAEKQKLIEQGYWPEGEAIQEINKKIAENQEQSAAATDEFEANSRRRILSMLEEQLSLDGLSAQEQEILLQKGLAWGVYSQEAVDATRTAIAEVAALTEAINTIPSERTFTMSVLVQGADAVGGLGAGFGSDQWTQPSPHFAGGSFMIPTSYGNEGFAMGNGDTASGGELISITPKGQGQKQDNSELLSAIQGLKMDYGKMARAISTAMQAIGQ